jgi:ABC-2 type transport system ATP-binding protein
MLMLVRKTHKEFGISVLLSSHLMSDVERTCDRIIVLRGGHVEQSGEVGQFTQETEGVFVEVDANRDALLAALARRGIHGVVEQGGVSVSARKGEDMYDEVRDALVEAGAPLRRMAPRRRTLTELFEKKPSMRRREEHNPS